MLLVSPGGLAYMAIDTDVRVVALPYGWTQTNPTDVYSARIKRLFDIAVSGLALICCAPLLVVLCALISLESAGSPIYVQRRRGMHGVEFNILKLRTMYDGTESLRCVTEQDDPRVTTLGRVLRLTKLDELPQLINILRGEMSVIGPRPLSVDECQFIESILGYDHMYPGFNPTVKPGLIGLEQLNRKTKLTYSQRFGLNHRYENAISAGTDLMIFMKSVVQCRTVCILAAMGALLEAAICAKIIG